MKFFVKDFFSKCRQIRRLLKIVHSKNARATSLRSIWCGYAYFEQYQEISLVFLLLTLNMRLPAG